MRIDKTIITETLFVAAGIFLCSAVMQGVFFAINMWDFPVLYGNLLSALTCIFNFFLLGLTVQNAVKKDEKQAKITMRYSLMMRTLMLVVVAVIGASLKCFNIYAVVIPFLFPRIAIGVRSFFIKRREKVLPKQTNLPTPSADDVKVEASE